MTNFVSAYSIDYGSVGIQWTYNDYFGKIQAEEQRIANVTPFTLSLSGNQAVQSFV